MSSKLNRNRDQPPMNHVHNSELHSLLNDLWCVPISFHTVLNVSKGIWDKNNEKNGKLTTWQRSIKIHKTQILLDLKKKTVFCFVWKSKKTENSHLTVWGGGLALFVIDVLLFFFKIGGLLVLSLLDDERFVGSACSMSKTFLLILCASGQCLATLCKRAVVDDVLNNPSARRRRPWLKHASTAAHNDVTDADCSCTNFRVTASSITCFTSFLTAATSRSLKSNASKIKRANKTQALFYYVQCYGSLLCFEILSLVSE